MRASRTEGFSALARRLHAFVARLERRDGSEPRKPAYPIQWPAEVDERHPDVTQSALPMNLKSVLDRFDAMRTATGRTGGRFGVASPVRMGRDGLKKLSGVSEDDVKHAEKDLQKVHDDYIHKIDDLIKAKEAEIMEV